MATKDHYVSQFHLRHFLDPVSVDTPDPWVWIGDIAAGTTKRRAPKNIGWCRGMFNGVGGFEDGSSTIEKHLACDVEPAAARAIWSFIKEPREKRKQLPPELTRYVAWAGTRSLTWTVLLQEWLDAFGLQDEIATVEPPLLPPKSVKDRGRLFKMEHLEYGVRDNVRPGEIQSLRRQGWKWKLHRDDLLQIMHVQAWHFQARFFPRLQWMVMEAPEEKSFVLGDRPVVWGVDGLLDLPPSALRNPNVQLIAPLSRSICLLAHHAEGSPPNGVPPEHINCWMAFAAQRWIVGANERTVSEALLARKTFAV